MTDPVRWIGLPSALYVHRQQIEKFGGEPGVRDPGLVESALARPRNLWTYGTSDPVELASAYILGLVRNHGFVDGNKLLAADVNVP